MYTENLKVNNQISIWLISMFWMISAMIIVGGLTRLTDSGLSITEWQLFSGFLPPLNEVDWNNYFNLYKKIPEFKIQNYSMTLNEFKVIFWWEWAHRFLGRLIGGITAATHATANAYMADISSPEEKAARFGMLGAGFGLGFVLGPLIGGLLGEWGPRAPFFAAAMLAAANGVLCYFVLKESLKTKNRREFKWYRANPIGAILDLRKFEGIYSLLLVFLLFTIGTSIYAAIWPFFTVERFSWSPGMIGISLTIYGVCFAIVQGVLVRPAIKIWGEEKTIIIGFCFEFSAMVTFAFLTDGKILIILIPLASLGVLAQPAIQAILSKSVGDDRQGAIQGVASSLNAIAMVITPITMTWILAVFSDKTAKYYFPGMPFLFSALMVLLCLFIISRRKPASTL